MVKLIIAWFCILIIYLLVTNKKVCLFFGQVCAGPGVVRANLAFSPSESPPHFLRGYHKFGNSGKRKKKKSSDTTKHTLIKRVSPFGVSLSLTWSGEITSCNSSVLLSRKKSASQSGSEEATNKAGRIFQENPARNPKRTSGFIEPGRVSFCSLSQTFQFSVFRDFPSLLFRV